MATVLNLIGAEAPCAAHPSAFPVVVQVTQDRALMIDLLRVNQKLRAGVALRAAWEGFETDLAAGCCADVAPPETWGLAVVAAQLSWPQVSRTFSSLLLVRGAHIDHAGTHVL